MMTKITGAGCSLGGVAATYLAVSDPLTAALSASLLYNRAGEVADTTSHGPGSFQVAFLDALWNVTAEQVAELIRPAEEELAHTICEEILAANGCAPQAVFLVGGGSKLPGLPELVANGLGLPVQRVAVGSRDMIRGITAPKSVELGTEHATPVGIAITASEGVKYDFTTITLNGRKIRALDTRRLTVFELCSLAGIKPEQLLARSGKSLSYTADGERIVLRGTHSTPCEISLNGKECSLNSQVRKGDEVNVVPAVPGEDAAALLSDQYDMSGMSLLTVTLDGRQLTAGDHILVNGTPTAQDADIENGAVLRRIRLDTLGALLAQDGLPAEGARVNGESQSPEYTLRDGDVITSAPEEAPAQESTEDGVPIVFNGMPAVFPTEPGRQPVFLDILAAFSDDPTGLLAGSSTVMINGKLARLDEVIHPGDEIVIE